MIEDIFVTGKLFLIFVHPFNYKIRHTNCTVIQNDSIPPSQDLGARATRRGIFWASPVTTLGLFQMENGAKPSP